MPIPIRLAWMLLLALTGAAGLATASSPATVSATIAAARPGPGASFRPGPQEEDAELEALLAEERAEADRERRRGNHRKARGLLSELLEDDPDDLSSRVLLARVRWETGDLERALAEARRAYDGALARTGPEHRAIRAASARTLAAFLLELGRFAEADEVLRRVLADLRPGEDARDALVLGRALRGSGEAERAEEVLTEGANTPADAGWQLLLAKARCERELDWLERASRSLVLADARARQSGSGVEPDVLAELADIYFEADSEVDHEEARGRSPGELYRAALDRNATHAGALLGLYRLGRFNWRRQNKPPTEYLEDLLRANPNSIDGWVAATTADLEDGRLPAARQRLGKLAELAPRRRDVRALEAALAWVEHRRDEAEALLAELAAESPGDGVPERDVGRILFKLYRFAEGVPFLQRSVERNPYDALAWMHLGEGLANTGDEEAGLEALERSIELSGGRANAWRHNTTLVLRRLSREYVEHVAGDLTFVYRPEEAEVLSAYQEPFFLDAREELSSRYGFTTGPVRIEVFHRFEDFSVRSTGFEGFPALGVCFGPVVTAVSPLSEMRGNFSWARTAFHEFTHVIHLQLSHNRCPRWITEGLATWEEEQKNTAWGRNMRLDLVNAHANEDLIPTRELNRAFRGPRILFGYYQGGLLCRMLIDRHGFQPMVRLLEAFDVGLDLDAAVAQVFDTTPEQIDADFREFVAREIAGLAIEPTWQPSRVRALRLSLSETPPSDPDARAAWADGWCTVAWAAFQQGRRLDSEQALRALSQAGERPPRALFLLGRLAFDSGDPERAAKLWTDGLAAGGEDFRVRMRLGSMAAREGDWDQAEEHYLAAEACFPGFPSPDGAAELALAEVYGRTDRMEERAQARRRWLRYEDGDVTLRERVARHFLETERFEEAAELYAEANEVDPFRRRLHHRWSQALRGAGRFEEALREVRMVALVPPELEGSEIGPMEPEERAELLALEAGILLDLDRREEAAEAARRALEIDPDSEAAAEVLDRLS